MRHRRSKKQSGRRGSKEASSSHVLSVRRTFRHPPSSTCTRRNVVLYHRENDIDSRPTPLDEAIGLEYSRALPPFTTHNSRRRQVWAILGELPAERHFGVYVQFPHRFRIRRRGPTEETLASLRIRSRSTPVSVSVCFVDAPSSTV